MKEKNFSIHIIALTALFVLGNAVIYLPQKGAGEYTFLAFLAAAILNIIAISAVYPLAQVSFKSSDFKGIKRCFAVVIIIAVTIFSAFCIADTFKSFIKFVSVVILPDTPIFFITVLFLAIVLFFISKRQEDLLKFSFLAFFITALLIVFFFFATVTNYNFRNIFIFRLPKPKEFIEELMPYIKNPVLQSLLLPFFTVSAVGEKHKKPLLSGMIVSLILLGICLLGPLLLFGPFFAGDLPYPYASAVSTVTVGRLFSRMDGFSYFIYFATALIKITASAFVIKKGLKRLNQILKRE